MPIITVPHPTLRQVARPVTAVDAKLVRLVKELVQTLGAKRNPSGVGLAAPQIDSGLRIFVTKVGPDGDERNEKIPTSVFINPLLIKHSDNQILGPNAKEQTLEGCLSIPGLYGTIPRFEWVTMEYQTLDGDKLVSHQDTFSDFHARVIQHEYDHLDGILFTDHSLRTGLPLYKDEGKELVEIEDRSFVELF